MTTASEQSDNPSISVAALYHQVAGVLGAFALISFANHFFDFNWKGIVEVLVEDWSTYVRPVTNAIVDATIAPILNDLFKLGIVIPQVVKDYFAAGLVLALSMFREAMSSAGAWSDEDDEDEDEEEEEEDDNSGSEMAEDGETESGGPVGSLLTFVGMLGAAITVVLFGILAWPLLLLLHQIWRLFTPGKTAQALLALAPILWFAVLIVANQFA